MGGEKGHWGERGRAIAQHPSPEHCNAFRDLGSPIRRLARVEHLVQHQELVSQLDLRVRTRKGVGNDVATLRHRGPNLQFS